MDGLRLKPSSGDVGGSGYLPRKDLDRGARPEEVGTLRPFQPFERTDDVDDLRIQILAVRETQGRGVDIDGDFTLARHRDDRPSVLEEIEVERSELFERPLDLGHRRGGHLEIESEFWLPQPIDGAEREQIRVGPEEGTPRHGGSQMSLPCPGIDRGPGNPREGCRPL